AVDPVPLVARAAEVVERFGGIDPAGAILMWCVVDTILCLAATNDSRSPASCRQRPAGMPPLPAERLQPQSVPRPNTVADNRRNEIGNAHGLAGTCLGSDCGAFGSGWAAGKSEIGSPAGSLTGRSRGSTMTVRSGLPICMGNPQFSCERLNLYVRRASHTTMKPTKSRQQMIAASNSRLKSSCGVCLWLSSLVS